MTFYAMPDPDDPKLSNLFDIFVRGKKFCMVDNDCTQQRSLRNGCRKLGLMRDARLH